jgi:CRP-like cAMP-binding protein
MRFSQTIEVGVLKSISLFGSLSESALQSLAGELYTCSLAPGDFAFNEDEPGDEIFVVLSGELEVLKRSQGGQQARVAMLGPGDWFGEMSVIDVQPRSASVRALADSQLVTMALPALESLYRRDVHAYASIVLGLAREMSRRLRVADGLLAELVANVVHRRGPSGS